jgi:hypothetical protein
MLDLRDRDDVVLQLEQVLRWFEEAGPLIPPGYVFSGQSASVDERPLTSAVIDLLDEVAGALADTGPFDSGFSSQGWLSAHEAAARAVSRMRDDRPAVAARETTVAVIGLHSIFGSEARSARRRDEPKRRGIRLGTRVSTEKHLRKVAAEVAPKERLLFASRARNERAIVATDRRLLVAERGPDGTPSRAVWSNEYAHILSIKYGSPDHGPDNVTLVTDRERFQVPLSTWNSREIVEVLSAIWECRRATTNRKADIGRGRPSAL